MAVGSAVVIRDRPTGVTAPIPAADDRFWLAVPEPTAAGGVRRAAVALGQEAGLDSARLGDLAIVAAELATNLGRHADDGHVLLRLLRAGDRCGVGLIAIDRGPGMADMIESGRDGHSTAGTLGIGLGSIMRQATEFDAYSQLGSGSVVAASVWDGSTAPVTPYSGLSRPIAGETACGDAFGARRRGEHVQLALSDGLGHGVLAAIASRAAMVAFESAPAGSPAQLLEHVHRAVGHTRGSVTAIAEIDPDRHIVSFAGIGNVNASIVSEGVRRGMVSLPGIVGQQSRQVREFEYPYAENDLIVLHSDGLTDRWNLGDYPGLTSHSPLVIASTLLRDAGRRRDDAAVLVARAP